MAWFRLAERVTASTQEAHGRPSGMQNMGHNALWQRPGSGNRSTKNAGPSSRFLPPGHCPRPGPDCQRPTSHSTLANPTLNGHIPRSIRNDSYPAPTGLPDPDSKNYGRAAIPKSWFRRRGPKARAIVDLDAQVQAG